MAATVLRLPVLRLQRPLKMFERRRFVGLDKLCQNTKTAVTVVTSCYYKDRK